MGVSADLCSCALFFKKNHFKDIIENESYFTNA